jgi:hypothetical protein
MRPLTDGGQFSATKIGVILDIYNHISIAFMKLLGAELSRNFSRA